MLTSHIINIYFLIKKYILSKESFESSMFQLKTRALNELKFFEYRMSKIDLTINVKQKIKLASSSN